MNPSEHLAFELEIEKKRLNSKINKLQHMFIQVTKAKDGDKAFLIEETIRKIQAQIAEIDKELARRGQ
ncbi:MAG: hypothetical protein WC346_18410 [Methanogenium sp.]